MTRDYSRFTLPNSKASATPRAFSPLDRLGWQPYFSQQIGVDALTLTPPVRIIEVHRNALHVLGDAIDETIPPLHDATVGDWLLLDRAHPQNCRILDRKSLLKRRAPGTERAVQLIAANIETAFIVTSCNADFNIARLERYVALALEAEITPVIVLTKKDLASGIAGFEDAAQAVSDLVSVVSLDARGTEPTTKLSHWCKPGQTVAFLGSSGVGKSTLTNALMGANDIETQGIREDDAKGRHTTTRRQLHIIPDGCAVLDTPGMRELQLTDVASGIGDVFSDLQSLAANCRFKDCQHDTEPGCSVRAALDNGTIDKARLNRWRKLLAEEAFNSASLSERRTKDKVFGKMVRQVTKQKAKRKWNSG